VAEVSRQTGVPESTVRRMRDRINREQI